NCEGDLLKHIRQLVGKDVVIGTVLDSHTHLGKEMLEYADLLIATKEYPHTDFKERSEELIELLHAASNKEIKPVSSSFDCRMIDNYHTPREPMRSFVNKIKNIEKEDKDILSISVIHSFPWGDSSVMGTKILVISDNNPAKGQQLAEQLGMELFSMRGNLSEPWIPMNDALDQAMATKGGPVVLADAADNPGGGAPCDSTFILQALIDRKI
ncbi:MAG: M81 family metallopeptidase, partial [Bacteroidetes bacterium]|nr:M81 family metallopeptidase [Bacteroidota bacterium]